MVEETPAVAPFGMRCTDADDQKFIDLALAERAVALLSADRAVLRLARRASAWGLAITRASAWLVPPPESAPASRTAQAP
jgi:predicted nucleic acid-binding protein